MNRLGVTLIEVLLASSAAAVLITAGVVITTYVSNQNLSVAARADGQVEIAEISREINKVISTRKIDDPDPIKDPLFSIPATAFPAAVAGACTDNPSTCPCTGLTIRQSAPTDPTGLIFRKIEIETICDADIFVRRSDIPTTFVISETNFSLAHPELSCPLNALPSIRIRRYEDQNINTFTDQYFPFQFWGAAVCFRLSNDKKLLSVELGGFYRGPNLETPRALNRVEVIPLVRAQGIEELPN